MKKGIGILIALSLLGWPSLAQMKQYLLVSTTPAADFNYGVLYGIDTIENWRSAFESLRGKYTVYKFMAHYFGPSALGYDKEFHDILIIKTNSKNKVIDGYQYTLEWGDQRSFDLFRYSAHNVKFKNGLKLRLLKLKNPENNIPQEGILTF